MRFRPSGYQSQVRETFAHVRTLLCTALTLVACAMNSILWRLALCQASIDAASFSTVRLASGVGYVIWSAALRKLTATRAATVQLAVHVSAAAGRTILFSEKISPRLLPAAVMILGGLGLALPIRSHSLLRPAGRNVNQRTYYLSTRPFLILRCHAS